jgi:hypothetical protein
MSWLRTYLQMLIPAMDTEIKIFTHQFKIFPGISNRLGRLIPGMIRLA